MKKNGKRWVSVPDIPEIPVNPYEEYHTDESWENYTDEIITNSYYLKFDAWGYREGEEKMKQPEITRRDIGEALEKTDEIANCLALINRIEKIEALIGDLKQAAQFMLKSTMGQIEVK